MLNKFVHPIPYNFSTKFFTQLFSQFFHKVCSQNLSTKCLMQFFHLISSSNISNNFLNYFFHQIFLQIFQTSYSTPFQTFSTFVQHFSPFLNLIFIFVTFLLSAGYCILYAVYWAIHTETKIPHTRDTNSINRCG